MRFIIILIIFNKLINITNAETNDTIKMSLNETEKIFVDSNLFLLAQRYTIDENKASVIQAKIWGLPNISITQGAYQTEEKKMFDLTSKGGEMAIQVQQLIDIAGKHRKNRKLAELTLQNTEYQFNEILRELKYQLRTDFFSLNYQLKSLNVYNTEVKALQKIVDAYTVQNKSGNISMKELVRLQSLLFATENDRIDLLKSIGDMQHEIGAMLRLPAQKFFKPITNDSALKNLDISQTSYNTLIDSAHECRPDLLVYRNNINFSKADLSYQRSLSKPDLAIMGGWDKNGSYITNYNYIGLGFDIPLWNINRGNIKAARIRIEENKSQYNQYISNIDHDIINQYSQTLDIESLYKKFVPEFNNEYSKLMTGMIESFTKHEVGLLEFTDFYESYKDATNQYYKLQGERINAYAEINFITGKDIFKLQ
jgi:cobalt-zinc-cadmium efflux system outer membrane protein